MSAAINNKVKRKTQLKVSELIAAQADLLNLSNNTIAAALNYPSPNVVSMLKAGTMRLPMNKVVQAAQVLQLDPTYLALRVDAETEQGLTPLIESISKRTAITLNEEKVIQRMRSISNNMDINLDEYPEILDKMMAAFTDAVQRESITIDTTLDRLKSKPRSALNNKLAAKK